jgi:hypothetical protein
VFAEHVFWLPVAVGGVVDITNADIEYSVLHSFPESVASYVSAEIRCCCCRLLIVNLVDSRFFTHSGGFQRLSAEGTDAMLNVLVSEQHETPFLAIQRMSCRVRVAASLAPIRKVGGFHPQAFQGIVAELHRGEASAIQGIREDREPSARLPGIEQASLLWRGELG